MLIVCNGLKEIDHKCAKQRKRVSQFQEFKVVYRLLAFVRFLRLIHVVECQGNEAKVEDSFMSSDFLRSYTPKERKNQMQSAQNGVIINSSVDYEGI